MDNFKKYWFLILIGLILRLVIGAFSFHPDVRTASLSSAVLFQENSLNFYSESKKLAPGEILDDLPLSYLILIPIHLIFRPLVDENAESLFLTHTQSLFGSPQLLLYLIYTKLPLILFDLMVGFLLALLVANTLQKKILFLWMLNPLTLWATAAIGQIDIFPTLFIILAWFLIKKGKLNWASLALGAGGAIKSGPFLLVPLLVGLGGNFREKFTLILFSLLPYVITVTPYLPTRDFRQDALLAPQLVKSFFAQMPLSGGEVIFIVPAILIFLYLVYFSTKRETKDFLKFSIVALLLVLAFTHFHIQWFLWVTPFLLLWLIENWSKEIILATAGLFFSLLVMIFLFDSSLQLKLFAPLFPILDQAKGLAEILTNEQLTFFRSAVASIFAACSIFLSFKILKKV